MFAAFFMLFAMANSGLPATSGFVGEFMVILGAVKFDFWIGLVAGTTLVFGAAYSLWMYKRVVFGEVANRNVAELVDVNARELLILVLLAAAVMWMGLYPKPVTDLMDASVTQPPQARGRIETAGRRRDPIGAAHATPEFPRRPARDRAAGRRVRAAGRRPFRSRRTPQHHLRADARHPDPGRGAELVLPVGRIVTYAFGGMYVTDPMATC